MIDVNLITQADFQALAPGVDISQYTPVTISGLISVASSMVSDYLLFTPAKENVVNEIRDGKISPQGDLIIYVAKPPVTAVQAVAFTKGSSTVNMVLQDGNGNNKFNIDVFQRKIVFPYYEVTLTGIPIFVDFFNLRGTYFFSSTSYTGGWDTNAMPMPIKMAVVYYMRDLMGKDYNQAGADSIHEGGLGMTFTNQLGKSRFVVEAERLLRPYRRIG